MIGEFAISGYFHNYDVKYLGNNYLLVTNRLSSCFLVHRHQTGGHSSRSVTFKSFERPCPKPAN
jgi:hypothetical protein